MDNQTTQFVFENNATDFQTNLTSHSTSSLSDGELGQFINVIAPVVHNPYIQDSLRFLFFGTILETGRRLWQWFMDRLAGGFVLTAIFDEGDPVYEWLCSFLNEEKVWSGSREFRVTARTSSRTWGVKSGQSENTGHAEYLPAYESPQLFCWKGTWIQVTRKKSSNTTLTGHEDGGSLVLTLYTRKKEVLDDLVETARSQYMKSSKPRITVHTTDHCGSWCQTTSKARRPMDSLILPTGVKEMLLNDARDFLRSEQWYADAGIQHKRGYLLYGAPGTGKSSTIHALAGELGLEIYSLSLAVNGLDDAALQRLVSSTPAHSLILIEDIDCAFPSREQQEKEEEARKKGIILAETKSNVTLSGLLNIIDGVSSEEGRLLFATTNHVSRLDPALLRAGRMDVKINYKMSTRDQIVNLFKRFYPTTQSSDDSCSKGLDSIGAIREKSGLLSAPLTPPGTPVSIPSCPKDTRTDDIPAAPLSSTFDIDTTPVYPPRLPVETVDRLASEFADSVPENTFTVAELQGYLLTVKTRPFEAVAGVKQWVTEMEEERKRMKDEEEKKNKKDSEKDAAIGSSNERNTDDKLDKAISTETNPEL
ncbi:hypothetical protein FRC03_012561 [Tulasnella sp. 419]|nr:hypothetical protein FRC03_012561 [Tulasnella sp. 419]